MTQINCIIKTPLKVYQMATTRRSLSIEYEKLADKVRKSVNKEYSLNLHFHSSKKIIGHHYYSIYFNEVFKEVNNLFLGLHQYQ